MTKQTTYLALGGAGVLAFVIYQRQKTSAAAAAAASASHASSLSGLIGGGIAAVKSVGDTLSNIFGKKDSGSDPDGINYDALSFLTTQQKLDLGMQVAPDETTAGDFFGPDINPFTGYET